MSPSSENPQDNIEINHRILEIDGVVNFRHMGGYKTNDGRTTCHDRLFRCGKLSELSEMGGVKLNQMNVTQVIDFRSLHEKEHTPVTWPNSWQPTYHPSPIGGNASAWIKELLDKMADEPFPGKELHNQFIRAFRTIPIENKDGLKLMFDSLIEGSPDEAAIFHCTAGKDRTGIAGALILKSLGVHADDIMTDFMLTNIAVDIDARTTEMAERISQKIGRTVSPKDCIPFAGVHEEFLVNAYDVMADNFGSVEGYLDQAMDMKGDRLERFKERFLT